MESLIIKGENKLTGEIFLQSAKNSVLPIIACCIMSKEEVILKNCPKISDIVSMLNIINNIGGTAYFDGDDIVINCRYANPHRVESSLTKCIRSSVFILGPIIARFKTANISYPGGCEIGARPIDLHIAGLKSLNIRIIEENSIIECDGRNIRGGKFHLSFPSVGATENIMMAAVLTKGMTVIENAAKEPEIVDLQNFINYLGGKVSGAGTSTVTVEGVDKLGGGEYSPITDRIIAGTIMAGCAMCGGKVRIHNVQKAHVDSTLDKILRAGCEADYDDNSITVSTYKRLKAIERIETEPFPYFPTDMQSQIMAMLSVAKGTSIVVEHLFENRFRHTIQLNKMGADITLENKTVTIRGVEKLTGTDVIAQDLRGGAALVLAGMCAEGITAVSNIYHIDRGYYRIEDMFNVLGANIRRVAAD